MVTIGKMADHALRDHGINQDQDGYAVTRLALYQIRPYNRRDEGDKTFKRRWGLDQVRESDPPYDGYYAQHILHSAEWVGHALVDGARWGATAGAGIKEWVYFRVRVGAAVHVIPDAGALARYLAREGGRGADGPEIVRPNRTDDGSDRAGGPGGAAPAQPGDPATP